MTWRTSSQSIVRESRERGIHLKIGAFFLKVFLPFFAGAGGLSANGNMFGNFARWNEPSREGSLSKKVDYKVVNASPVESPSSSSQYTRVRLNEFSSDESNFPL